MTQDITHYKKLLGEERTALEQKLNALGRRMLRNPDEWEATSPEVEHESERGDVAMNIERYNEREALTLELQTRYKEVADALERIHKNTYGLCTAFGKPHPIEKKRLDADPAGRTCIAHMRAS
ncbi:MAG TPA: hypothetical protein ENI56_01245 [Candidatus Kaiserbacteria bacterium]|nr:hypothetical protein [Candidatus Kaiserbacteria bacterium]